MTTNSPPPPGQPELGHRTPGDTAPWFGPTPPPKKRRLWLYLAIAVGTLLVMAATVAVTLAAQRHSDKAPAAAVLTEPVAQRACRTAIESDWKQRTDIAQANQTDTEIVVSLQGIDVQETWKNGDGYSVNAVVRYTLTTGIIDPVSDTISLTCTATGTDAAPITTVSNRG
jgi:hypothetical protein